MVTVVPGFGRKFWSFLLGIGRSQIRGLAVRMPHLLDPKDFCFALLRVLQWAFAME